jgi:hypothetical protein
MRVHRAGWLDRVAAWMEWWPYRCRHCRTKTYRRNRYDPPEPRTETNQPRHPAWVPAPEVPPAPLCVPDGLRVAPSTSDLIQLSCALNSPGRVEVQTWAQGPDGRQAVAIVVIPQTARELNRSSTPAIRPSV